MDYGYCPNSQSLTTRSRPSVLLRTLFRREFPLSVAVQGPVSVRYMGGY